MSLVPLVRHNADCLREYRRKGGTCGIHSETRHQHQIAAHIDGTGHRYKNQRGFAVAKASENCRQNVIGNNEENIGSADADINGSLPQRLFGSLHEAGDWVGKAYLLVFCRTANFDLFTIEL